MDQNFSFNYYWYHHLAIPSEECDFINKIVIERHHDWKTFLGFKKKWENKLLKMNLYNQDFERYVNFFPMKICWSNKTTGQRGHITLTEETFKLITHAECECG